MTKNKKGIAFLFVRIYNKPIFGNVTGYVSENGTKMTLHRRRRKRKMIRRKLVSLLLATTMIAGVVTGCGEKEEGSADGKGSVYYLSFKPEQTDQWKAIAAKYTEQTGIEVKVQTAASGTYEQTLKSEIAKKDAPTLFQINGPVGYQSWKDYCMDLSGTNLYSWLKDKDMAVTDGDGVYGIPYVVEGYGIIYNQEIMDKYFALDGAKDSVTDKQEIEFKYNQEYKNILDLYVNNSCTKPSMLGSKTVENSMSEFALGKVAMIQNGNWAWGDIKKVSGNVVKEDKIKFLPIYTGISGEESQGLCIGTENFFSVNSEASKEDQEETIKFVEWLFNSDEGKKAVTNELGFIAPFNTFEDADNPTDPLAKEVIRYMDNESLTSVSWNFTSFPSQTFKDDYGASLLEYITGNKEWDNVVEDCKAEWKSEKEAIAE